MNKFEQQCMERREFPTRSFAHFDPATGAITSVTHCNIPSQYPGLTTAVFDNVDWSIAVSGYRVDLNSVRDVEGDHPHCELIPDESKQREPLDALPRLIIPDTRTLH